MANIHKDNTTDSILTIFCVPNTVLVLNIVGIHSKCFMWLMTEICFNEVMCMM